MNAESQNHNRHLLQTVPSVNASVLPGGTLPQYRTIDKESNHVHPFLHVYRSRDLVAFFECVVVGTCKLECMPFWQLALSWSGALGLVLRANNDLLVRRPRSRCLFILTFLAVG